MNATPHLRFGERLRPDGSFLRRIASGTVVLVQANGSATVDLNHPDRCRAHFYATRFPAWANVMNYHHDVIDRLTPAECLAVVNQAITENDVQVDYSVRPPQPTAH